MAEKWLVIDDSATIQRVIKLAFQDYDVLINEADSIQEALRELSRSPFTLVIADAALAGVQSVQDFVRLQQAAGTAAFVVLEGSYDHIDENQFRGAGFRYFLRKPFDASQLIAITREALGRPIVSRFDPIEAMPPPAPNQTRSFSLQEEEPKSPPPLPGPGAPVRSLHEELEHPFDTQEGFDLGLEDEAEAPSRFTATPTKVSDAAPFSTSKPLSHDELFDSSHRAKPYFPQSDEEPVSAPQENLESFVAEASYGQRLESSYNPAALSGMLEPMLREEMAGIVREAVEDYCRKHFAELAREYLTREIEKLSTERARLLVDK